MLVNAAVEQARRLGVPKVFGLDSKAGVLRKTWL